MNCAWLQARGVAENVGVPGANPGWPEGGFWSHTCSGIKPLELAAAAIACSDAPAALSGGELVLAALAGEDRPDSADRGLTGGRETDVPRCAVALLAVAVSGVAVPEAAVRGEGRELSVDHADRAEDVRVIGRHNAETDQLKEARIDDRALVKRRAAVPDAVGGGGVRVAVLGQAQVVGRRRRADVWAGRGQRPGVELAPARRQRSADTCSRPPDRRCAGRGWRRRPGRRSRWRSWPASSPPDSPSAPAVCTARCGPGCRASLR